MNQVGGAAAKETWTDEVTDLPPNNFRGLVTVDPASQIFAAPVGATTNSAASRTRPTDLGPSQA